MLRPISTNEGITANALLSMAALRDDSLTTQKVSRIALSANHRQSVLIDDNPIPQPIDAIAKYLGAPAPFLQSADLPLAQHIIDHQFRKVKAEKELVFRNDRVIGSQPTGKFRVNGLPAVQKVVEAMGEIRHANFYDFGDYVDVTVIGNKVTMPIQTERNVNDITEGGIRFLYSELLARQPSIEPYVSRLICTNGMICREYFNTIKFETMDKFIEELESSVGDAMKYIDKTIRAQLQKAAETKIERSEQVIRQIFESNKLNPKLLGSSLAALTVEDDGTAFGVLQAITRSANAAGYVHRIALQQTGAKEMARLETVHCPTCWSSLTH
jgi:hypothetical protein